MHWYDLAAWPIDSQLIRLTHTLSLGSHQNERKNANKEGRLAEQVLDAQLQSQTSFCPTRQNSLPTVIDVNLALAKLVGQLGGFGAN